jgi:FtsH-binding integral membrane protein
MTEDTRQRRGRVSTAVLVLLAIALGCALSWLALGAALSIPGDHPSIWFGLPLVAVAVVAWLVAKRFRWGAVALGTSGVATLLFFVWLFWQMGQGLENFD